MKLIIPMAGLGKRMRPHTLVTPKPLLKVAGTSIVERIINDFVRSSGKAVDEIHFIIGAFGKEVEQMLLNIGKGLNVPVFIHYQDEALGTAHAIYCAKDGLKGEVCIAFADTLYIGDVFIESNDQAIIWTYKVSNPENYGVVITNDKAIIQDFAEKPKERISDEAIVGMYYFQEGELLKAYLERLIKEKRMVSGEFQLTDTLKDMLKDGIVFKSKNLVQWLDFGSKDNFLSSIQVLLKHESKADALKMNGSEIIDPVYIGKNVKLKNSTIGPNVIIEDNTVIVDSSLKDSVIGCDSIVEKSVLNASLIGNFTNVKNFKGRLNIGDYNEISD